MLAEKQEDAIIPDGVLPFQIDKDRVGELFRQWMKGRWLAPGELKHLYQRERLQGIYLPYWTFDAKADARYTAMGGRRRTVTRKGPDGKTTHHVVTDWYPTSGALRHAFDDVLVPASHKLDGDLLRRAGVFGTPADGFLFAGVFFRLLERNAIQWIWTTPTGKQFRLWSSS